MFHARLLNRLSNCVSCCYSESCKCNNALLKSSIFTNERLQRLFKHYKHHICHCLVKNTTLLLNSYSILNTIGQGHSPCIRICIYLFHPRCREVAHSTWHSSTLDEENSRRWRSPCISSINAWSLLSTKDKQLQKSFRHDWLRLNRIVTDDPV